MPELKLKRNARRRRYKAKPGFCGSCQRKYADLNAHNSQIHMPKTALQCALCNKVFLGKKLLDLHVKRHDQPVSTVEPPFQTFSCTGPNVFLMANLLKKLLAFHVRKRLSPNITRELSISVSEIAMCVVRRWKTWRGTSKTCTANKKNQISVKTVERSSRQSCNLKDTTTLYTFTYETNVMNVTNGSQWLTWKLISEKFTDQILNPHDLSKSGTNQNHWSGFFKVTKQPGSQRVTLSDCWQWSASAVTSAVCHRALPLLQHWPLPLLLPNGGMPRPHHLHPGQPRHQPHPLPPLQGLRGNLARIQSVQVKGSGEPSVCDWKQGENPGPWLDIPDIHSFSWKRQHLGG